MEKKWGVALDPSLTFQQAYNILVKIAEDEKENYHLRYLASSWVSDVINMTEGVRLVPN